MQKLKVGAGFHREPFMNMDDALDALTRSVDAAIKNHPPIHMSDLNVDVDDDKITVYRDVTMPDAFQLHDCGTEGCTMRRLRAEHKARA